MWVVGLDNRKYHINLSKYYKYGDEEVEGKSDLHLKSRRFLQNYFRNKNIYEEVKLPGSKTNQHNVLFADFFIPRERLIVEAHGRQHLEYVRFFHQTKKGFQQSLARDRNKEKWAEINNITLIVLWWNESESEWRDKISSRSD